MYEYTNVRIKTKFVYIVAFVSLVGIDQAVKYIIRTSGGFYICNSGIAWGISPFYALIGVFFVFILLFIFLITNYQLPISNKKINIQFQNFKYLSIRNWKLGIGNLKKVYILAIILILTGAISNILDRLMFGCVIDFIDLGFWPVFNLADVYITIGGIILISHNLKRVTHTEKY